MALFVDGPSATIDDLTDQDSGLLDIAQTCGINATAKLRLAHEEIRSDLELWLHHPRPSIAMVWQPALRIEQIVATPTLRRWEAMQALASFYRDAYFSQFADRYQAKWDEYARLSAGGVRQLLVATGLAAGQHIPYHQAAAVPFWEAISGPQSGGTFYASVYVGERARPGRSGFGGVIDQRLRTET